VSPKCIVRQNGSLSTWYDSCATACALPLAVKSSPLPQRQHHIKATWDFTDSLEGWANATATEMEAEVYSRGGELRGIVVGTKAAGR
jgi:hypothetical protein